MMDLYDSLQGIHSHTKHHPVMGTTFRVVPITFMGTTFSDPMDGSGVSVICIHLVQEVLFKI